MLRLPRFWQSTQIRASISIIYVYICILIYTYYIPPPLFPPTLAEAEKKIVQVGEGEDHFHGRISMQRKSKCLGLATGMTSFGKKTLSQRDPN